MVGFAVEASRFDRPMIGAVEPGLAGRAGRPRAGRRDRLDRRQAADELGGRPVPRSCCGPRRRSRCACAARAASGSSRCAPRRQEAERIGSIGVHPLVRVGQVLPGQPAEAAGLQSDDAILSIDGKPLTSFTDIPPHRRRGGGPRARVPGVARRADAGAQHHAERLGLRAAHRDRAQDGAQEVRPGGRGGRSGALDLGHDAPDLRRDRAARDRADLAEDDDGSARHRPGVGRRGARRGRLAAVPGGGDQPPGRDPQPVPARAARRRAPRDPGDRGRRAPRPLARWSRAGS